MAIAIGEDYVLTGFAEPQRIEAMRTSSGLLRMLGAKPLMGRLLLPEDDTPGKPPVAVLTHGLWKRLFGSDPHIVGKSLNLSGTQYTVAGVIQPGFLLNNEVVPTVQGLEKTEMLVPLPFGPDAVNRRGDENYNIVARLKPGVTPQKAQADIDVIAGRIREKDKRDPTFTISVVPLLDQVVGNVRTALLVLLGSVALVLLIACANVANMLLSRATAREKELAIRTAMGAERKRLLRQLLTESVTLGVLGGILGLVIAYWSLYALRTLNPGNIPRLEVIGIDVWVLLFTFAVSILTGIGFGLAPAFRVSTIDVNTALKAGGRSSLSEGGFGSTRHRLRGLLVISQLALSLMLLIGAGLLIRSFLRLQTVPPGFDPGHVLSAHIQPNGPKYRDRAARVQFYEQLTERLGHLPGVIAAGATSTLPFTSSVGWGGMQIEGYTPPPNQPELQVDQRIATPDYFRAMEISLRQGRFFTPSDTPDGMQVVLVDQKMADHFWTRDTAVGKRVRTGSKSPWLTIVGVVGTVKQYGLEVDGRMVVYYPHKQAPGGTLYVVARFLSDPATMSAAIAQQVHTIDPAVPVYDVQTMPQRVHASLARQRFAAIMLGAFAVFALILAAVGVYGVMSYLVSQATRDIGVRIALGAQPRNILTLVVRQGMSLAVIGIVVGLLGAFALTRVMATLLFGVSATDFLTFSMVAAFLAATALLATYIPARRATRVDPMVALRYE
jgi:predicted permease